MPEAPSIQAPQVLKAAQALRALQACWSGCTLRPAMPSREAQQHTHDARLLHCTPDQIQAPQALQAHPEHRAPHRDSAVDRTGASPRILQGSCHLAHRDLAADPTGILPHIPQGSIHGSHRDSATDPTWILPQSPPGVCHTCHRDIVLTGLRLEMLGEPSWQSPMRG